MSRYDLREMVVRYHDGTKHHFERFARSLGYLDWASQPNPFRTYIGAPVFPLYPAPGSSGAGYVPARPTFGELLDFRDGGAPLGSAAIGDVLRHALGLSAWKQYGRSRWSLRINPSSGNLHPTEAYVVAPALPGLADSPAVYHYAPERHALEQRCTFSERASSASAGSAHMLLVALTSIHWRESWKYGERAFRYCQHDLGHAMAAIGYGAALAGWRTTLLPCWSYAAIGTMTGVDRDGDFIEAEREEPGCVLALTASRANPDPIDVNVLIETIRNGRWSGRASQLSEDHVQWTFIDDVADATREAGHNMQPSTLPVARGGDPNDRDARTVILQRRSALALDGRTTLDRAVFFQMLTSVIPDRRELPVSLWWRPKVHFALFVHRVTGLEPGLYLLARDAEALPKLRSACRPDFLWEPAHDDLPLVCLSRGDCRWIAARLSCDQEIAADGFFSLGMIAEFDGSLDAYGPSFYRNLFWESGVVGQVLYLQAEAAGARATGIGCFYDDPVHALFGLQGHAFQSLYHFTVGMPVEDPRLTSESGYEWER